MSYPPSGPNVPPPPGGPFGQQPGSYGQQGSGEPGQYGQPGAGYPGQPGYPGQGGQPPKKSHTGLIAAIIGAVVLVLLVCCIGGVFLFANDGDDDGGPTDQTTTSETTESTTESTTEPTSETTTEPTSESSSSDGAAGDPEFPDSFDGWKKMTSSSASLASYRKGADFFTAMSTNTDLMSGYENVWGDVTKIEDVSCGTPSGSSNFQCAGMKDGSTILISSSYSTAKETADVLKELRNAL